MEEKELVKLSKEGSEEAFGALVQKYKIRVFNLAFSLTHDRETADDLAQEVFVKAYFALPKFKFKSAFGTWIYRIAINHSKDYLRKKGKVKQVSFDEHIENVMVHEDETLMREKENIEEQRRRIVHNAIHSLPEKYQVILSMRDIQSHSYEEIATILNLSPGTVDSRLHRARKLLRKKLSPFLAQKRGEL